MVMVGEVITSWLSTLVLFRLMVSPKTLQAWENLSMRRWSSCSVKDLTARKEHVSDSCPLAQEQGKENTEEGGSKDKAFLTPLLMSKESEMLPSYWIVAFMSSWKDLMRLCSFGDHPIFTGGH